MYVLGQVVPPYPYPNHPLLWYHGIKSHSLLQAQGLWAVRGWWGKLAPLSRAEGVINIAGPEMISLMAGGPRLTAGD